MSISRTPGVDPSDAVRASSCSRELRACLRLKTWVSSSTLASRSASARATSSASFARSASRSATSSAVVVVRCAVTSARPVEEVVP
jgi:hypothetical protein